jgi:hypothetical protein
MIKTLAELKVAFFPELAPELLKAKQEYEDSLDVWDWDRLEQEHDAILWNDHQLQEVKNRDFFSSQANQLLKRIDDWMIRSNKAPYDPARSKWYDGLHHTLCCVGRDLHYDLNPEDQYEDPIHDHPIEGDIQ